MNSADAVSPDAVEMTRKAGAQIQAVILQRLARVTQTHAAACMGVSASTVSRMNEDVERVAQLLAACGMKVADQDAMVVERTELDALESMAFKYLELRRLGKVAA